jgi:hypothetical protein
MIDRLSYRANFTHKPGYISDVFDSILYRELVSKKVIIDGIEQPYNYFSGSHDIAFALCIDSYLLFKRRRNGPSSTPILLQNYNLDPRFRIHLKNNISLGAIPGPHQPKHYASFLAPFDCEMVKLALGVPTFDAQRREMFTLRAYVILELGDIVAVEKMLGIKGHNGFCPCRSCMIHGVRRLGIGGKNYYVPLTTPKGVQQQHPSIDPASLQLRSHEHFGHVLQKMQNARTKKDRERIAKKNGIREAPGFGNRVNSIDFARSFPWEWFHLFLENIVQNLVKLWTGRFPGYAPGSDFEIAPAVWKQIGEETAKATENIPSAFVRAIGNVAEDQSSFTAESWSFWFIYLAPILLRNRFQHTKYYNHMMALVDIMKTCLKFEITLVEIDGLEKNIIKWVKDYER